MNLKLVKVNTKTTTRILLLTSAIGLIFIALSFGVVPHQSMPAIYELPLIESVNQSQMLRANMGAMLASAIMIFIGYLKPKYLRISLIFMIIYMAMVAFSRLLGFMLDEGTPSLMLRIYFAVEVFYAIVGYLTLRKLKSE